MSRPLTIIYTQYLKLNILCMPICTCIVMCRLIRMVELLEYSWRQSIQRLLYLFIVDITNSLTITDCDNNIQKLEVCLHFNQWTFSVYMCTCIHNVYMQQHTQRQLLIATVKRYWGETGVLKAVSTTKPQFPIIMEAGFTSTTPLYPWAVLHKS